MIPTNLIFVAFEPNNNKFNGLLAMDGMLTLSVEHESLIENAAHIYTTYIHNMRVILDRVTSIKAKRQVIPASLMWELGDLILNLVDEMGMISLQIDGLYDHLTRDLNVRRMWLEKVIIFRRHLSDISIIPADLNWGKCRDAPRKVADMLSRKKP